MKLKYKIFLLMTVFVILLSGIYSYQNYVRQRRIMMKGIRDKLYTAALMAKAILPDDYHDRILNEKSVSKEEFDKIVDRFNKLCAALDMEYLWSLLKIDDKIVFTTSTSPDKIVTNQKHAKFFERHTNPKAYTKVFSSQQTQYNIIKDKWGIIKVALIPFKDSKGRQYIFGASMKIAEVDLLLSKTIKDAIYPAIGFIFIGLLFSYILANFLSKPFNKLIIKTSKIVSGDIDKKIEETGSYEEITLAKSFNRMNSEIKKIISELKESKNFTDTALNAQQDTFFLFDPHKRKAVYWNKTFSDITGYTNEEISAKPAPDSYYSPSDLKRALAFMEDVITAGVGRIELELICKNGRKIPTEYNVSTINDEDGNPKYIISIGRDITARKQVEKELRIAKEKAEYINEAKTEFLMNISHDIRTPMNVINGFNNLLMQTPLNKEQQKFCNMIKRKGIDLINLLEDIIDITALEKGNVRMHEKAFNIHDLISDITSTAEIQINGKGISFETKVEEDVPDNLIADPLRLKQILENLCTNAVKYTEKGGITFSVSADGYQDQNKTRYIRFTVQDTGIGIPENKLPRIFEPYSRFYEIGKGKEKDGVGMGLHIVNTLVKEMDGEISVTSELNQGSTFSFVLPMKQYDMQNKKDNYAVPDNTKEEINLSGLNILVAEDDDDNRILLARALEDSKCIIQFAGDGTQVIEELRKKKYDLILMDLRMPKMDGFEATQIIRRDIDQSIPIFAVTAHVVDWVEDKCTETGMNGYIAKPIDIDKIKKAIRSISSDKTQA